MALLAGTVAVAEDGTVTATANSMAKAIYDEFVNNFEADTKSKDFPNGQKIPDGKEGAGIKRGLAVTATRVAGGVVAHIAAHAVVTSTISHVAPGGAGLQFIPASITLGAPIPCDPPDVDRTITGTVG